MANSKFHFFNGFSHSALGVNLLSRLGAVVVVKGVGQVPRSPALMLQLNFILLLLSPHSILILIYLPL